jgi:hypothetical protein
MRKGNMGALVVLYNASTLPISITTNQGTQIPVTPTSANLNWAPQRQDPKLGPTYAPGFPAPNVIGNAGVNVLEAQLLGVPIGGTPFKFSIPAGDPVGSVQIYVFFSSVQSCSWLALVDGKPIAQQSLLAGDIPRNR